MPNRIIKESLCDDEKIANLSDFEFRVWIGLIVSADDAGRGDARPAIIKGHVFPLRERVSLKDIDAALHAMAAAGCVSLYMVGGRPYYRFPNWAKHQRVRDAKPKYPGEEEGSAISPRVAASCGESPRVAASCGLNTIQSNTIQSNPERDARARACASGAPQEQVAQTIPTEKEVFDFCTSRGYHFDVVKFYRNYFAQGRPCPDWQQKAEKWEKTERPAKPNQIHGSASYGPTEADMEGMRKFIDSLGGEKHERKDNSV